MTILTRRAAIALTATTAASFAMRLRLTSAQAAEDSPVFSKAVDEGLAVFRRRAQDQLPLARTLTDAIRSRDLARAQVAYIASRPPYEEIEVLAASFEERDKAIDARPYAFAGGETDETFRGFHKVEALVFRDRDLAAALPVAEELERSLLALVEDLRARENFSAMRTFAGCLALATEIGAKKISSEEETWSDRSLLIFRHNLIGIDAQVRPFAAELVRRDGAVAKGLDDSYTATHATIDRVYGAEPGGTAYSRIGVADRKAISDATYRYRDALARAADLLGLRS